MIVLGIDFETTGLDVKTDRITEVGAVLWDTATGKPLMILSELVYAADYPPITEEITGITGITQAMLDSMAIGVNEMMLELVAMMPDAKAIIAHNGTAFDFPLLENECARMHVVDLSKTIVRIDTAVDVPYPANITTRNLRHLAAEHGFLNPFAHRAVFDVLTMLSIFQRYDADEIVKLAQEPMVTLVAIVSYDERDKAKARGFHWNAPYKRWEKNMRKSQADIEVQCEEIRIRAI